MIEADIEVTDGFSEIDSPGKELIRRFTEPDPLPDHEIAKEVLKDRLNSPDRSTSVVSPIAENILTISSAIDASDKVGALLYGFEAEYIEPGSSGLITGGNVRFFRWEGTSTCTGDETMKYASPRSLYCCFSRQVCQHLHKAW